MEKNNLSFVETETLVSELISRFDGLVIMAVQNKTSTLHSIFYHRWNGNHAVCAGLTKLLDEIIMDDYKKGETN